MFSQRQITTSDDMTMDIRVAYGMPGNMESELSKDRYCMAVHDVILAYFVCHKHSLRYLHYMGKKYVTKCL